MDGRSEVEAMAELAQQMWERYFKAKVIQDLLSHSLDGYKATVTGNNADGTLTVIRPFDSQAQTLRCPPALAQTAQNGDQVLVIQLGDASNSFILCGTDLSGLGDGGSGTGRYRPVSFDFSTIEDAAYYTEVVEGPDGDEVSTDYSVTRDQYGRIDSVVNETDGWGTTVEWGTRQLLPAADVSFDPTGTSLQSNTAQGAISELANGGGGGSGASESIIATVESSSTASKNYAVKDYLILSGVLYRVTSPITSGGTITVGTNVTVAVLGDDVSVHIQNTNNPHGVTAAQVGAYVKPASGIPAADLASGVIPTVPSISSSTPQMDGIGAAGSTGEVSDAGHVHPTDTSRAPAGYGIGEDIGTLTVVADANAIAKTGWYATDNNTSNLPASRNTASGSIYATVRGSYHYQVYYDYYENRSYERYKNEAGWSEWYRIINAVLQNVLHNAYFVGGGTGRGVFPVNQRGAASYTASNYSMDRWKFNAGGTLTLSADGISWTTGRVIYQYIDPSVVSRLTGKVTFSYYDGTTIYSLNSAFSSYTSVGSLSVSFNRSTHILYIKMDTSTTIKAVKLEPTPTQTLGHQVNGAWVLDDIPDYEQELIKCQISTADSTDTYANKTLATEQQIAQSQVGNTANRNYAVGAYFCWNGLLYRAISPISSGATLTVNTNCVQTTVMNELVRLTT